MPETGPYSLLILSFAIFSFVMLQLQRHPTSPPPLTLLKLGGGSALVMVSVAARLTVSQMLAILPPAEPDDLTMAVFDALLVFAFLVLLTTTAIHVAIFAATADPLPK